MSGAGQSASVRVFISYSSKDADLVQRLKDGLARAGVDVWLDHERLTPGTPNWQRAIRDGIAQASHVIYVASETAAESPYVYDEISLARGKWKKPVIPFWARGEEWHDCAPLGFGLVQYADGRDANFDAGLAKLMGALGMTPRYPLPDVPARLAGLGFRGVNPSGTPAIVPPLITIPGGPFLMGSNKAKDRQAADDELPQHRVEVAAFQIAKYPVTVAEYALAVRAGAVREPATGFLINVTWEEQQLRQEHPVVTITWKDATEYSTWLKGVSGQLSWRLPTEAEWEKAARWNQHDGASRIYPWGDEFDQARCNTKESGINTTSQVDSYPGSDPRLSGASFFGVEEMAGGVEEWTSSLFRPYPFSVNDGRENPSSTEHRSLRGGSWYSVASHARAAFRDSGLWDAAGCVGFRLALTLADTAHME